MQNLMKQKFLPNNNQKDLFSKLQDLKQNKKSVVKYTKEFFSIT